MKKKLIFFSGLLIFASLILVYSQVEQHSKSNSNELEVTVESAKSTYFLGELVLLNFEINNNTASDVYLGGTKLNSGYLTISISFSDNKFKKYRAVGTGKKTSPTLLKKGEQAKSSSKILWNANLAENCSNCEAYKETDILTYYAFPAAGSYHIKAVLHVSDGKELKQIESEPIKITIKEPSGEDLEVWNQIKDNGDFAYFIQEGNFRIPSYKPEERAKFEQKIEQIINQHPNSFYAESLRQSLVKFRANEEKRKAYLEKRKQPN